MRASFSYWTRWAGRALRTLKLSAVKPLRNPVHHCPCVNVIRGRQSNVVIVTYLWRWHSLLQFGQAVILAKDIKAGAGLAPGACGPSWTLNALRPRGAGWPASPVGPVGPVFPGSPVGPMGPVSPCGPVGPVGPASPCGPVGPAEPVGPVSPASPCGPVGPGSPCGPVGPAEPVAPAGPVGPGTELGAPAGP